MQSCRPSSCSMASSRPDFRSITPRYAERSFSDFGQRRRRLELCVIESLHAIASIASLSGSTCRPLTRASGHPLSSVPIIVTYHPCPSSPSGFTAYTTVLIGFRSTSLPPPRRRHAAPAATSSQASVRRRSIFHACAD